MSAETVAESIPPGYKQTEVGVIPEDWELDYIENLTQVTTGSRNTQDRVDDGLYPFFVRSQTVERINSYSFDGEAVLTAGDGVGTGKVFHYIKGKFDVHQRVYRISDFNERIKGYYFYLYFSNHFYNRIMQMTAKSSVDSVRWEMIGRMLIPIPPKIEQEAIATALSDTDALIESLEQLIAKKRQIKQGAMQELLTGKRRLPGFSGEWEMNTLGSIVSRLANGAVYKATNSSGMPITRIETIADGTIDYSRTGKFEPTVEMESYKLMIGDILFSHINSLDHIGKVAQFLDDCPLYHGMNLLLIRASSEINNRFLYYWFTSSPVRKTSRNLARQAVSQASINTTELKAVEILLPPLSEQTAIATILSDMNAEITALEEKLAKTRQIKQGMMQELLTGRIRLV